MLCCRLVQRHIREQISSAAIRIFPNIQNTSEPISFFYKPRDFTCIATPCLFQLANQISIPPSLAAHRLMSAFEWNNFYVIPDPELKNTISSGFLNFAISPVYLMQRLKQLADEPFILQANLSMDPPEPFKIIHEKIASLLSHTPFSMEIQSIALLDFLQEKIELQILELISISEPEELHSQNAAFFFLRTLYVTTDTYLKKIPIFTSNTLLTLSRISLIRVLFKRLCELKQIALNC